MRPHNILHAAAEAKQNEIVHYLVEQVQLDPSELDDLNRTPLTYACINGDIEIANFLVKSMKDAMGMSKEDIFHTDNEIPGSKLISSPLCCACFKGHLSIVKYLVEECECDPHRPENGVESKTPIHIAVYCGHLHVVKYLVGIQHVINYDHTYCTPTLKGSLLHTAAEGGYLIIVKYLLTLDICSLLISFVLTLKIIMAVYRFMQLPREVN